MAAWLAAEAAAEYYSQLPCSSSLPLPHSLLIFLPWWQYSATFFCRLETMILQIDSLFAYLATPIAGCRFVHFPTLSVVAPSWARETEEKGEVTWKQTVCEKERASSGRENVPSNFNDVFEKRQTDKQSSLKWTWDCRFSLSQQYYLCSLPSLSLFPVT